MSSFAETEFIVDINQFNHCLQIFVDSVTNEAAFWNLKAEQSCGIDRGFIIDLKKCDQKPFVMNAYLLNPSNCPVYAVRLTNQLKNVTLPKIKKWMENDEEISCNSSTYASGSITLVDLQEYNQLYNELKVKYGEHMTKVSDLRPMRTGRITKKTESNNNLLLQ